MNYNLSWYKTRRCVVSSDDWLQSYVDSCNRLKSELLLTDAFPPALGAAAERDAAWRTLPTETGTFRVLICAVVAREALQDRQTAVALRAVDWNMNDSVPLPILITLVILYYIILYYIILYYIILYYIILYYIILYNTWQWEWRYKWLILGK